MATSTLLHVFTTLILLHLIRAIPTANLSQTPELSFSVDTYTTPYLKKPRPKLECNGVLCAQQDLQPLHVYCTNEKNTYWRCSAALPRGAEIDGWSVHCEEYTGPDVVVKGSCWLSYNLTRSPGAEQLEILPASGWSFGHVFFVAVLVVLAALCVVPLPTGDAARPLLRVRNACYSST